MDYENIGLKSFQVLNFFHFESYSDDGLSFLSGFSLAELSICRQINRCLLPISAGVVEFSLLGGSVDVAIVIDGNKFSYGFTRKQLLLHNRPSLLAVSLCEHITRDYVHSCFR